SFPLRRTRRANGNRPASAAPSRFRFGPAPLMLSRALYPGSFDTFTFGHLNIVERSARMFETLIVAVADNPKKRPLFTREERIDMLRRECARFENVEIAFFEDLTVEFALRSEAFILIRGLRAVSDFEY